MKKGQGVGTGLSVSGGGFEPTGDSGKFLEDYEHTVQVHTRGSGRAALA